MLYFINVEFICLVFMSCTITIDLRPQTDSWLPKLRVYRPYQEAVGVTALHYLDEVEIRKNCMYVAEENTSLQ
jgi:hypothetical protein